MLPAFVCLFVLSTVTAVYFYVRLWEARDFLVGIYSNANPEWVAPEAVFTVWSIRAASAAALGGAYEEAASVPCSWEKLLEHFAYTEAQKADAANEGSFPLAMRWLHADLLVRRRSWPVGRHLLREGPRIFLRGANREVLSDGSGMAFYPDDVAALDWRPCDANGEEVRHVGE